MKHILLQSNAPSRAFPDNRPDDFITLLKEPLEVSDGWLEMAVEEIFFVNALPTIQNKSFRVTKPLDEATSKEYEIEIAEMPTSIQDLVKEINKLIAQGRGIAKRYLTFAYDPREYRVGVVVAEGYSIELSTDLKNLLGFATTTLNRSQTATSRADMRGGVHTLYLCSDATEKIEVGGEMMSLLGAFSLPFTKDKAPRALSKVFENRMFVKLLESRVEKIRLYIRDSGGKPTQFKFDPVVVRLAIRKRSGTSYDE